MSEPGTAPWRRAEASRLLDFGRGAELPDGGFGWLGDDGAVDPAQPCPLYINARMTHVFALAHLQEAAGADSLAASGIVLSHTFAVGWKTAVAFSSIPAAVTTAPRA